MYSCIYFLLLLVRMKLKKKGKCKIYSNVQSPNNNHLILLNNHHSKTLSIPQRKCSS